MLEMKMMFWSEVFPLFYGAIYGLIEVHSNGNATLI